MAASPALELEVDGQVVRVTNPAKPFFPEAQLTKLDVVQYYLAVAPGALVGVRGRPMAMKRFPDGAGGEFFFQKRAPPGRPPYVETVRLSFPSGRSADEVVIRSAAGLAWLANLGCLDLNPHPVRAEDVEHPDELRVDLDPGPGVPFSQVREVAQVVREVLESLGYRGFPKTSGSRGIHVNVRLQPRWGFAEVRRAALALAREVERRAPSLATSKWWKEERHGVFLDYNQNAKDRTVASAYSVRPTPDARVSWPFRWEELPGVELADFTVKTVPALFAARGDAGAAIDEVAFSLEPLLELVARHEAEGQGDAPWPPHYAKQAGEPPRVQPSRQKKEGTKRAKASPRVSSQGVAMGKWYVQHLREEKGLSGPALLQALARSCAEGKLPGGLSISVRATPDEAFGPLTQALGSEAAALKLLDVKSGPPMALEVRRAPEETSWWEVADVPALVDRLAAEFPALPQRLALLGEHEDAWQVWVAPAALLQAAGIVEKPDKE